MCGLFGIVGRGINRDDLSIFKDLMLFSAVRGIDATGVAVGNSNSNNVTIIKKTRDAIYYLQTLEKKEEAALDNLTANFFLGHTRWATTGKKTVDAAQPFEHGKITGTHNGTITSIPFDKFNSDSDALFSRINELGIRKTISLLKPSDSYALVYYDKSTRQLNFLRNIKRVLYFALNEHRETLYYSSENGILNAALWRHGISTKIYYFSEDINYSINPTNLKGKKGGFLYDAFEVKPEGADNSKKTEIPWIDDEDQTIIKSETQTQDGPNADV